MQSTKESRWQLRLPSDCSISGIRQVYDLVRDAFSRQDKVEIDCSSVDKADVTPIQLLISTAKTANSQGGSVVLPAASGTLSRAFERAGFSGDVAKDVQLVQRND